MSESINIILKALANSSVSRSTRGIVMLVIKDANVTKYKEYNSYKQVEEGYEDKNLKFEIYCNNDFRYILIYAQSLIAIKINVTFNITGIFIKKTSKI